MAAPTKEEAPKETPFLASLADTGPMIEQLRAELAAVETQKGQLDLRANDLNARIAAYNTLRQAHGLSPV